MTITIEPMTHADETWQSRFAELHQALADATAAEIQARAVRDQAIVNGKAAGVPVSHLASAAGISREVAHRVLRQEAPPLSPPAADQALALAAVASAQGELNTLGQSRSALEDDRASAIAELVGKIESSNAGYARIALVSEETIRKIRNARRG